MRAVTKYHALYEYLRGLDQKQPIKLTFDELEAAAGLALPLSARASRAWWANSRTPQGQAWLEAGWLVDAVDIRESWVVLRPERITYRITPRRRHAGWSAQQVKALREHTGWSQQELADQLGMRQQTISEWETGKYHPRRSTGVLLAFVAERVGFRYLAGDEEEA